jgi:hypothetical protein
LQIAVQIILSHKFSASSWRGHDLDLAATALYQLCPSVFCASFSSPPLRSSFRL